MGPNRWASNFSAANRRSSGSECRYTWRVISLEEQFWITADKSFAGENASGRSKREFSGPHSAFLQWLIATTEQYSDFAIDEADIVRLALPIVTLEKLSLIHI